MMAGAFARGLSGGGALGGVLALADDFLPMSLFPVNGVI
jgi:hypothetical protein